MKIIVATDKNTNVRYGYCGNSGFSWFAPLVSDSIISMSADRADKRVEELKKQQLIRLFRQDMDGVGIEAVTVNLNGFTITVEDGFPVICRKKNDEPMLTSDYLEDVIKKADKIQKQSDQKMEFRLLCFELEMVARKVQLYLLTQQLTPSERQALCGQKMQSS